MGRADYFKLGSWNVDCDRCGFKFKADNCAFDEDLRGKNLFVCHSCRDLVQPQDFVKAVGDKIGVPIVREHPEPTFVDETLDWDDF